MYDIPEDDILVPADSKGALLSYKTALEDALATLKQKRDDHPELFEADDNSDNGKKSLLDALYEDGVIPTYSFPKNVVSTYISDNSGKVRYQVERGLDVAIGEYAPGRAIVVDKTTYQIGGLYYPGGERSELTAASPARSFINDASYRKTIRTCSQCGWFGLEEDNHTSWFNKFREVLMYLIFGVLTTVVNIVSFYILRKLSVEVYVSNVIAWILSVLFAFITNKLFVFESKGKSKKENTRELISFFGFRILSLGFDMGSMFLLIDILHVGEMISKVLANVLVIVLNYVFSKLFIFKK